MEGSPEPTPVLTTISRLMGMSWAVIASKHDPEDTLMLSLTHQDVAVCVLGLVLADEMCPEFESEINKVWDKLREVSDFQEFLARDENGRPRYLQTPPEEPDGDT